MKKILLLLFIFAFPPDAFSITTTIPAGTTESNGNVDSATTQEVYGQADNFTVSGHQNIQDGGIANNSVIYPNGEQYVGSGGSSYNTNVEFGGLQVIAGTSYYSTIQSNGTIDVNSGGSAQSTSIEGGTMSVLSGGSSSGTILSSGTESVTGTSYGTTIQGGNQQINRYGKSQNAKLNGGTQNILVRGTATNTSIISGTQNVSGDSIGSQLSGGIMNISSTGYAENTTIDGGTMNVNSGGFSSQTLLQSGIQNIYGQDINGTVTGGTQNVLNGGVAEDTIIQGGIQNIETDSYAFNNIVSGSGIQQVATGGYSYRSQVSSGGTLNASGGAYEANVSYGSTLNVLDSGLAQDTTLKGGTLNVEANATSQNTTVSDGIMNVSGTDTNASITGGTQNIQAGGTSTSATISSSGIQNIYADGISSSAQLNLGGKQFVFSSGTADSTKINGGAQFVYGNASNTIINRGLQEIRSGGISSSPKVTGGGILTVENGGIAEDATLTCGTLRLQPGGALSGLTSAQNSIINISGNHSIPNMQIDTSLINITRQPQYTDLSFDNLSGNGIIIMSSDLSAGISDQINVQSGTGNFGLIINDYSTGSAPSKLKIINEDSSAADNFYLVGGAVDVGAFQYQLLQESSDWFLENTNQLSDTSYMAQHTFSALFSLFYTHLSPIHSRLRLQHQPSNHSSGLWTKSIGRRIKHDYQDSSISHIDIFGQAIGFDHNIIQTSSYTLSAGIYGGFSSSHQKFSFPGKGIGQTYSFGVYSSFRNFYNWFIDTSANYFTHHQKNQTYTPADNEVLGSFDTDGWHISLTSGKRIDLANRWFIEPFAGFNYMYVQGVSYQTNFNTPITAAATDWLSSHIGIGGGRYFPIDDKWSIEAYSKAKFIYDFDAKTSVEVADYLMSENMASSHYELTFGLNSLYDTSHSAYLEFKTQFGNHVNIPAELSLGYQYIF